MTPESLLGFGVSSAESMDLPLVLGVLDGELQLAQAALGLARVGAMLSSKQSDPDITLTKSLE